MDEYNKYAALADTIKIEDITSCEQKQNILKQIKENDEDFTQIWICNPDNVVDERDYDFDSAEELAWLGYYLGLNTSLEELYIRYSPPASCSAGIEVFRRGLGNNKSIRTLSLGGEFSFGGSLLPMLDTFLENNKNLDNIEVEDLREFGAEDARQLSLALGGYNKALKAFRLSESDLQDGQLVDIITALSMHPQLMELRLSNMEMGRNECAALSTLLRWSTTKLITLNLHGNNINDEEVEVLVDAVTNVNTLQELNLAWNQTITIKGWKTVATLLEMSDTKLEILRIHCNMIGDEGALVFANALVSNSTLKTLDLDGNGITSEGWAPFSKLLCDTSTVNKTFMSNHTLRSIAGRQNGFSVEIINYLALNRNDDKQKVAITKILQNHSFDMQPFFEWEFSVLPIMIRWFTKAADCTTEYEEKIKKMRLSVVYDFIREFPMLYVEARTQEEIKKQTALEMQLQRAQLQLALQLEEVQRCKARAMRRL